MFLPLALYPTGPPPLKDNSFLWPLCQRNGSRSLVDELKALFTSCGWKRLPEFTLWWVLCQFVPVQIIVWALATSIPMVMLPHFGNRRELGICLLFVTWLCSFLSSVQWRKRVEKSSSVSEVFSWDNRLIMYISVLTSYICKINDFTLHIWNIVINIYVVTVILAPIAYCFAHFYE